MNGKIGILALTTVLLLAACGSNTTNTPVAPTVGAITVSNASDYTVIIKDASGNTVPSSDYNKLAPGTYTVTYSQAGFVSQSQTFTVSAGQSVVLVAPTLVAVPVASSSGAFYLDAAGKQVAITQDDLNNVSTRFVFYAWLEDQTGGIDPTKVGTATNPGVPAANELQEVAPLNTQNVAAGYVGYKTADGTVRPIVGANVRWDILTEATTGSVRFSAADDGGAPSGAISRQDINDNATSANTYTNSATGSNARFPSSVEYPLYNVTGVNTPDTSGFTWTALNHDPKATTATARVRVVAYVNGTEITKRFLDKAFAPSAKLSITKTVNPTAVGLNQAGNYTVTVTNTGAGLATGIKINDVLKSGDGAPYSITAPAGTTANGQDGFDAAPFDLAPGASKTFTFSGQSSAVGVFCDVATVVSYANGAFGTVTPNNLNAQACLTVTAPTLNIIKTLGTVDSTGAFTPIASGVVVGQNTPVFARITVNNAGNAPATNVVVTDQIDPTTVAANYAIKSAPVSSPAGIAATVNPANTGFTTGAFNLAAGGSTSFTFSAAGTTDGQYCDTGTFTATSNNGTAVAPTTSQLACFKVASPKLIITKVNTQSANQPPLNTLTPGSSYNSQITVTNSGSSTATAVAVSDLLGKLQGGAGTFVNFGSGNYTVSGTTQAGSVSFANNTVSTTPPTIDLAPGAVLTLNVTSTVPRGAPAGSYCDVGSYTSTNAGTGSAQACVNVVTFLSEQTQLTDTTDPIRQGDPVGTAITGLAIVEPASNEAAVKNVFVMNFGATSPIQQTPGIFTFSNTQVYYDPTPARDPVTGAVNSNETNGTARLLVLGTDYTVSANSGVGQQTITMNPAFAITPSAVVFLKAQVAAPAGTAARQYQETLRWTNVGQGDNLPYDNFKAESTTVIP
ncbi:beta strand repeat-containing protein [Deinococcus alpinitundrae]|uniref:beta strand repeat-containing protein n=1 Tax=Deinococcus alpinitundrae TaxID=468913 RepID=UPI001379EB5C|nr:phage tail tube protein [Deinococcus alpinitundrae]